MLRIGKLPDRQLGAGKRRHIARNWRHWRDSGSCKENQQDSGRLFQQNKISITNNRKYF